MMIRNVRIPLEEMSTPRLQEVHAYWVAVKGERFAPRPDEIRPEELTPRTPLPESLLHKALKYLKNHRWLEEQEEEQERSEEGLGLKPHNNH